MIAAIVAIELVTFHRVDGRVVQINPAQVTQIIHPHESKANRLVVPSVKCIIRLVDGGFVSVIETCDEVQQELQGEKP